MKIEFNVKGTEKQVNWCKDILKDFNDFMSNLQITDLKDYESEEAKESYETAEKLVNIINNDNASNIIFNKEDFKSSFNKSITISSYIDVFKKYAYKNNIEYSKLFKVIKAMQRKAK